MQRDLLRVKNLKRGLSRAYFFMTKADEHSVVTMTSLAIWWVMGTWRTLPWTLPWFWNLPWLPVLWSHRESGWRRRVLLMSCGNPYQQNKIPAWGLLWDWMRKRGSCTYRFSWDNEGQWWLKAFPETHWYDPRLLKQPRVLGVIPGTSLGCSALSSYFALHCPA